MDIALFIFIILVFIGAAIGASAFLALLFWVLGEEPKDNEINNN